MISPVMGLKFHFFSNSESCERRACKRELRRAPEDPVPLSALRFSVLFPEALGWATEGFGATLTVGAGVLAEAGKEIGCVGVDTTTGFTNGEKVTALKLVMLGMGCCFGS